MIKKGLALSVFLAFVFVTATASAAYTPKPGDLLRTPEDPTVVLVMDDGVRVPISADGFAVRYKNNFGLVKTVTHLEHGAYSTSAVINANSSLPSGSVFKYDVKRPEIYLVVDGVKKMFRTWAQFLAAGYKAVNIKWVGQYTQFPTGNPVN